MIKGWAVLLLLLCCGDVYAQKNKCDCGAFLSTEYAAVQPVYLQPGKKTEAYTLMNTPLEEDFVHFTILAQKGSWLQVAPYDIKKWYDTGWVDNSHIAVYGRNYVAPINIYIKDDTASGVVMMVPVGYEPEYHVTGCKGKWLQVSFLYNEAEVRGWLSPDDQCGSAYTNCK